MNIQNRWLCLATTLLVGSADQLIACTCSPSTLDKNYEAATAVFSGYPTIVRLERVKGTHEVVIEFHVESWWKGERGDTVVVWTRLDDCGADFRVGKPYIVFASWSRSQLRTDGCSGNQSIDAGTVRWLNQLAQTKE